MSHAQAQPSSKPPNPPASLDQTYRNVAHLLRRAGFGDTPDNILTAARLGLNATIDRLVNYEHVPDSFTPPDTTGWDDKTVLVDPVTVWWLRRMITTARPFLEKMVLFWHGHFATANFKVRNPLYMYNQNQLFRQLALGSFDDLLIAVYKDPAMLIWLDGRLNTRLAPNENYGREVMELFTLGRATGNTPNYTEDDVHANARAFTGWRLDPNGQPVFVPRLHDDGPKTLLGHTGNWNGDDVSRILAAQPATARFLSTKLWQFFASDAPPSAAIDRMAGVYFSSNHSIGAVVETMLTSPEFYGTDARTNHVKSPTDFVVSTIRQLGLTTVDLTTLPRMLALLGQELFNPVNVGGWPGGVSWINAATMLGRFNLAARLTGEAPGVRGNIDPLAVLIASGAETVDQLVYYVADRLGITMSSTTLSALRRYAGRGSIDSIDAQAKTRGLVQLALVSPEYQIA
jgi:uncharacterized protein (DUF1800 family)